MLNGRRGAGYPSSVAEDPTHGLLIISAVAVAAPICAELAKRLRVPSVLFELLLGMAIGPSLLNLVHVDASIHEFATLGLCLLFFVAGYEVEVRAVAGRPILTALSAWAISLALGLVVALLLVATGFAISTLLLGLCCTTTAIGTLLPILRDRGLLGTKEGTLLLAAGSVGEFGPIVAITVLVGAGDPTNQFLVLGLFFALVVGLLFLATRHQPPKVVAALQRQLHSSTQLPIRLVLFFVVAMSALAVRLGIDLLLGAFAAGMVIRLGITEEQAEGLEPKLDAVGYGFFIPIFFIVSGIGMDAHFFTTLGALRIPIFCGLFLVVRGIPALFIYRRDLDRRSRWGFAVLQSTALPLLVVLTQIGLDTHTMLPVNASAIVAAGMLSVLAFPLIGFSLITAERALVDAGVVAPAS